MRFTALLLLAVAPVPIAQSSLEERAAWNEPVKPFRIVGNVYYVGVHGVSAFLVTTPEGNILLDGGFPETAPLIEKSISELGFRLKDVKFLLSSHAHHDHCGGLAELKARSGASMVASAADSTVSNGRRQLNCFDNKRPFPAVAVDRAITDKDTVQLGGAVLTAHITPGHTKGCTTWTMTASDGSRTHRVVFACSTSVAGNRLVSNIEYPNIVSDYEMTFAKLRQLPCDVFLASHGSFFGLDAKAEALRRGRNDAFADPTELRRYVDESERAFRIELAQQR